MRIIKQRKGVGRHITRISVLVLAIIVSLAVVLEVKAADPYARYEYYPMVKNNPASWRQDNEHYGGLYFTLGDDGDNFAGASCGIHSLATMFAKAGYTPTNWESSDTGKKYKEYDWPAVAAHDWAMDYGYGRHYVYRSTGDAITTGTNGKITHIATQEYGSVAEMKQGLIDGWNKGYFALISGFWGGISHIVAFDFVDTAGDVFIIDSAWNYKYLESMTQADYVAFYEVDGIDVKDAPKFGEGDVSRNGFGDDSGTNDRGNDNVQERERRGECYQTPIVNYCADMEDWKNELIEYDENIDRGAENAQKGVQRKNQTWQEGLLGN